MSAGPLMAFSLLEPEIALCHLHTAFLFIHLLHLPPTAIFSLSLCQSFVLFSHLCPL